MNSIVSKPKTSPNGFVLIALLWVLAALSLLALDLASTVRTEAGIARSVGEAEKAYFVARGGMEEVIYRLSFPDKDSTQQLKTFPYADGMNHFWISNEEVVCHVAILDEAGKLDLNQCKEENLQKLMETLGVESGRSTELAQAIDDWRKADHSTGSSQSDQPANRPALGKPGLMSVEDLLSVPGMSREILYGIPRRGPDGRIQLARGLAQYVTVYSKKSQINLNYAAPEVLASLPELDLDAANSIVQERQDQPYTGSSDLNQRTKVVLRGEALSQVSTEPSGVYCLIASARLRGSNVHRSLRTIVKLDRTFKTGHERLMWYDEDWPPAGILKWTEPKDNSNLLQVLGFFTKSITPMGEL